MKTHTFETEWGGRTLSVETGLLANQANGSCTVRYGDTVVMATAVMSSNIREGIDYFPLMVDFDEKLYAAGIIKSSRFMKREGRPSDSAILTGRMIDRTIRPLFNSEFRNDVQVVVTPLSVDEENDPDIPGLVAASIALSISDIPWEGPIAGIRIGRIASSDDDKNPEWVINPTYTAREKGMLDLVVCGTPDKVVMVEAEAQEIPENTMVEAIEFGQKHVKGVITLIDSIVREIGKTKMTPERPPDLEEIYTEQQRAHDLAMGYLAKEAPKVLFEKPLSSKFERAGAFHDLADKLGEHLAEKQVAGEHKKKLMYQMKYLACRAVSDEILKTGKRVDGREIDQVRPLDTKVQLLPRTHGSGLFMRGETQVMSVVTLGSPGDVQLLEGIEGSSKKRYMHHYNFPPYSVGEARPMRGPGRREIGHGALAERALAQVLPDKESFPYTIRVVSEVFGSNGSSSMASTCGSSLALMDAGVPIKKTVAGIAMGLASNDKGDWKVITDIQDLEDGEGGMDFKIAGTRDGITAMQMDTKTLGLNKDIVRKTFEQGLKARIEIIDAMEKIIPAPREELSQYAPRIQTLHIDPEMIRVVIGPGGKTINEIIDKTGVSIDIEQDGTVFVASDKAEGMEKAIEWIENLTKKVEAGEVYDGKVTRLMNFGAFVEILPGQEGLVHISEISWSHVDKIEDVLKVGDEVKVKVKEIDDQDRINLSMKALIDKPEGWTPPPRNNNRHGGGGRRKNNGKRY